MSYSHSFMVSAIFAAVLLVYLPTVVESANGFCGPPQDYPNSLVDCGGSPNGIVEIKAPQLQIMEIVELFRTDLVIQTSRPHWSGYGIRCHFCNSENDLRCADHFNASNNVLQETCDRLSTPGARYVCRKVKYHRTPNEATYSRTCALEEENPCSGEQLSRYPGVEHCSTCSTDLCNSAPVMFKITSLFGPALVFLSKIRIL